MKKFVVDVGAVQSNINMIKKAAGSAEVIADLSCDAQGLGLVQTAGILRDNGIGHFAVYETEDAERLRKNGFVDEQILMLRSTVSIEELERLADSNVTCTIGSFDAGIALNSVAGSRSTVVEAQIKVDSGTGQYGFEPSEIDKIVKIYRQMPGLAISGIYTRFSGPEAGKMAIRHQLDRFEEVLMKLNQAGIETGLSHALDSYSLFKYDLDRLDAVCVGSAIAGRIPGISQSMGFTKVGYIEADIEELDWMPSGSVIGTGKGVKLRKSTKVAVIPVGWYNGVNMESKKNGVLLNLFSRKTKPQVRVGGKRVKVIGDIGANCILIDTTDIECGVGDTAAVEAEPRKVKGLSVEYRQ